MIYNCGDVTKMDGSKVCAVDIITGGSPCQNFSNINAVNNNKGGLEGDESKLFYEMIRVIKEMRESKGKPRFVVFENVPSVLYNNNGDDFATIMQEFIRVVEPNFVVSRFGAGAWSSAGLIEGENWSLAWRVMDAACWGVAQSRSRIAILVDYDGKSASEILHKGRGKTRYGSHIMTRITSLFGDDLWTSEYKLNINTSFLPDEPIETTVSTVLEPFVDKRYHLIERQARAILRSAEENDITIRPFLKAIFSAVVNKQDTLFIPLYEWKHIRKSAMCVWRSTLHRKWNITNYANTILCGICMSGSKNALVVTLNKQRSSCDSLFSFTIRRFTPLETERLFGYPDGWTEKKRDGNTIADTHRYRMLGNTIALPQWEWLLRGISESMGDGASTLTLGSLFDGIGGFPLCAQRVSESRGYNPNIITLWVSEIDPLACEVFDVNFNNSSTQPL